MAELKQISGFVSYDGKTYDAYLACGHRKAMTHRPIIGTETVCNQCHAQPPRPRNPPTSQTKTP